MRLQIGISQSIQLIGAVASSIAEEQDRGVDWRRDQEGRPTVERKGATLIWDSGNGGALEQKLGWERYRRRESLRTKFQNRSGHEIRQRHGLGDHMHQWVYQWVEFWAAHTAVHSGAVWQADIYLSKIEQAGRWDNVRGFMSFKLFFKIIWSAFIQGGVV